MIRKPLYCPTCGDTWKRVVVESFVRLGPPVHECRACWTPFGTGEKEWPDLERSVRIGYFMQNLVIILPCLLFLVIAIGASYFFGFIGLPDGVDYFIFGSKVLLAFFILLNLWSVLMIVLSRRRVSRPPAPSRANRPVAEEAESPIPQYPQGRPNPRPDDASEQRGWPL